MSIKNRTEIQTAIDTISDGGENSASKVRGVLNDITDSTFPYAGVISDGNVPGISVSATKVKHTDYTTNNTSENDLFKPDQTNGQVQVKDSGLFVAYISFTGQWAANEDLSFEVFLNGVATGVIATIEGLGVSDPQNLLMARRAFVVPAAAIGAIDPGVANIDIRHFSTTGSFTLEQLDIVFDVEYVQGTIRAVG